MGSGESQALKLYKHLVARLPYQLRPPNPLAESPAGLDIGKDVFPNLLHRCGKVVPKAESKSSSNIMTVELLCFW